MNFEEAKQRYTELRRQKDAGTLSSEQFAAAVAELRVQDDSGRWWQMDPVSGQWMFWDGSSWLPASPPSAVLAPSIMQPGSGGEVEPAKPEPPAVPPQTPTSDRSEEKPATDAEQSKKDAPAEEGKAKASPVAGAAARVAVGAGMRMAAGAGVGAVGGMVARNALQHFMRESKEKKPLSKRSQGWWDVFAILGGLVSGYLWFVYSGVRGLPTPTFLGSGWGRALFGFLPAGGFVLIPILMLIFRKVLFGDKYPPIVRKLMLSLPLLLMIFVWLGSAVVNRFFTGSGGPAWFRSGEGVDIVTPLLVMGIPVLLVWFRSHTDAMLRPLQPLRQKVPKVVLIGVGLATPFVIAFFLYYVCGYACGRLPFVSNFGFVGGLFRQYNLLRLTMVFGTLISYVILRTPVAKVPGGRQIVGGLARQAMRAAPMLLWMVALGVFFYHGTAWADDFLRDPFNLNDGLRTGGFAPVIAGTASTVVTVLVNGAEVVRVVFVDPNPDPDAEGPGERANFQVVVDTVGASGGMSTDLIQGTNEIIYIYANCQKEGAPFPQGDPTITFSPNFDQTFATLTDMGTQNGRRCAKVELVMPAPEGTPPSSITVLVGAGEAVQGVPVTLSLEVAEYILELR